MLAGLATAPRPDAEFAARRLAGLITVTLQAALLVRHAPAAVADAFCASRLGGMAGSGPAANGPAPQRFAALGPGIPFGTLPGGLPLGDILDRARPAPR